MTISQILNLEKKKKKRSDSDPKNLTALDI